MECKMEVIDETGHLIASFTLLNLAVQLLHRDVRLCFGSRIGFDVVRCEQRYELPSVESLKAGWLLSPREVWVVRPIWPLETADWAEFGRYPVVSALQFEFRSILVETLEQPAPHEV